MKTALSEALSVMTSDRHSEGRVNQMNQGDALENARAAVGGRPFAAKFLAAQADRKVGACRT